MARPPVMLGAWNLEKPPAEGLTHHPLARLRSAVVVGVLLSIDACVSDQTRQCG
jgi:hypothetical protein